MEDTPPHNHRTQREGESLVDWRLRDLESSYGKIERKLDLVLEKMNEKESGHLAAVERCSKHGDEIEKIRDEMDASKRDPLTFWTAVGGAATAAGAVLSQVFGGRHP